MPLLLPVILSSCASVSSTPDDEGSARVPLAQDAAWPKFRGDAAQTGRGKFSPTKAGPSFADARPWELKTAKGIFSSAVIGGDGTSYIGSADRTFYAIDRAGQVKWKVLTGEIIDSSALLDDKGRVYFGSGDGKLRALDAATGAPVWTMQADDPAINKAFINWFEGNVAMGPSGTLYVPNDNFFFYAIDRDTGAVRWRYEMPDQTWSLPAVDPQTERIFVGNNNVVPLLGANTFAIDKDGQGVWTASGLGSIAASPLLAGARMIVGGFDGWVRAYDRDSGDLAWEVPTRDHVYASPSLLHDGTIVQASADGTVYALDPATGATKWTFDTLDPIRSSPAIDVDDNIYFGGGDGRLWVLDRAGKLRWSMQLASDDRNDLNGSPALGPDGIVIAGESGQIFGIPYDWCVRPEGSGDARCSTMPRAHGAEGATLRWMTPMGSALEKAPETIDANQPITLQLDARAMIDGASRARMATLDASSIAVDATPAVGFDVKVAGDGKFVTLTPRDSLPAEFDLRVTARYLVDHERRGLRLSGGRPGGDVSTSLHLKTNARGEATIASPTAPGESGTTWEISRLALPMPTLMPSYNQIGFDSLHYLVGMIEPKVAWMIGAKLADGENTTVVDPATRALFPLEVTRDGDRIALASRDTLRVEVMNVIIPFKAFRISARLSVDAGAPSAIGLAHLSGSTVCETVPFYGLFLQTLGLCNAQTDELTVVGAANLRVAPVVTKKNAPAAAASFLESASVVRDGDLVRATLTGSRIHSADHVTSLLLVDAETGTPITLDYGVDTARTNDAAGNVTSLAVARKGRALPAKVRAHVIVDTTLAATLALP